MSDAADDQFPDDRPPVRILRLKCTYDHRNFNIANIASIVCDGDGMENETRNTSPAIFSNVKIFRKQIRYENSFWNVILRCEQEMY